MRLTLNMHDTWNCPLTSQHTLPSVSFLLACISSRLSTHSGHWPPRLWLFLFHQTSVMGHVGLTPPTPTHQGTILPPGVTPIHCWTQDRYLDSNQQLRGDWAQDREDLLTWHPLLWKRVLHEALGAYRSLDTDRERPLHWCMSGGRSE